MKPQATDKGRTATKTLSDNRTLLFSVSFYRVLSQKLSMHSPACICCPGIIIATDRLPAVNRTQGRIKDL